MQRRNFLAALASLPFLGWLKPAKGSTCIVHGGCRSGKSLEGFDPFEFELLRDPTPVEGGRLGFAKIIRGGTGRKTCFVRFVGDSFPYAVKGCQGLSFGESRIPNVVACKQLSGEIEFSLEPVGQDEDGEIKPLKQLKLKRVPDDRLHWFTWKPRKTGLKFKGYGGPQ